MTFDLVSTWGEDCGIFEYAHALLDEPHLGQQLGHVFAHDVEANVQLDDTDHIHRCWTKASDSQDQLAERLMGSSNEALWVQYHPSFFTPSTREALAAILPKSSYTKRVLTVHNPDGLRDSAFAKAFTHITVHNESALDQMGKGVAAKAHVVPHFIYSRSNFERQSRGPAFTIATAGFAAENKRVPFLIDAFSMAHSLNPELRLQILTSPLPTHSSAFEMSRIKAACQLSSAREAIQSDVGKKSMKQLLTTLSATDLLCMPYADTGESASGAARLGLSAGVPILRSDSSIFHDLPGGDFILENSKVETLAEALLILSLTPTLLANKISEIDEIYTQTNSAQIAARFSELLS